MNRNMCDYTYCNLAVIYMLLVEMYDDFVCADVILFLLELFCNVICYR